MADLKDERGEGRMEIRRHTPAAPSHVSRAYGLPPEVIATAVRRLGFIGLLTAVMFPAVYAVERLTQPVRVAGPIPSVVAAAMLVLGAAMCWAAWSGRVRRDLALDLGLVFEVVVAFALSLDENTPPWPPDQLLRGVSWNCLWISMYVVAIPGTYGKSLLAAAAAACMGPFGLLVAGVVDDAAPTQYQMLNQLLPFVAAAWSIPVARHFHHLGTQVSHARAMGSYELVELIGEGGMGEVWSARHRMLARVSAVKLIHPEALTNKGQSAHLLLRRFEREARATAALRSPHTVALYDYGATEDGSFFYAMELLDGLDLQSLVHRFGPAPAGRAVHLLTQAAKSLAEAHQLGIVHRDIKPRNLFACRLGTDFDFVKVLDFGLAKVTTLEFTETGLTQEGATAGTPAYMAPEVAMGCAEIDGRADLYGLGCVGYWLLTGRLVFEADGPVAMALAHVQRTPDPPSRHTELPVPESLDRLILQCLEKDRGARPESARRLVEMLGECAGIEPWMQKDAEQWWRTHMPEPGPVRTAVGEDDKTV